MAWWFVLAVLAAAAAAAEDGSGGGTSFDLGGLSLGSLRLLGDAHLSNGSIRLSSELPVPNSGAGRALYAGPVRFRHAASRRALSFSTFFSFSVSHLNPSSVGGGLAFLLAADDRGLGPAGPFLGLPDGGLFFAVEFDTLMDPQLGDISGNHVGVDLSSVVSAAAADLPVDLKSGDPVYSWVDYDGAALLLRVFVSTAATRPADPAVSLPIDLSRFVNDFMFVGFSAATQASTEAHDIHWWTFSSAGQAAPPPAAPPAPADSASSTVCARNGLCRRGPGVVAGVATGGAFFLAAFAGAVVWATRRRRPGAGVNLAVEMVSSPREYSYRELCAATKGFHAARIIGHGAFGTVYKGVAAETSAALAVKRCTSLGGGAEFYSELTIIAGLRHRNLVRLQGWCMDKGEILLVYDYMPNGSLDQALHGSAAPPLPWRRRRRILAGVAAALAYLHRECEKQVIHRDVKSSNVMLDEGFEARLGDFGLARQADHGRSPDAAAAAGTMGYLAPEYLLTGRATEKSDAFSFGVLVLEVASGRRPIGGAAGSLVEWVWGLQAEGRLAAAADGRLMGEYDEAEMKAGLAVGLLCAHPDPAVRPTMRSAGQMLTGEAAPPVLPLTKPSMSVGSSSHHLLLSLQDSDSDCNALAPLSSSSSSSSRLGDDTITRRE
ncbi:concanavalin A-like lectin protein kinase family protein [Wolffia australiana]